MPPFFLYQPLIFIVTPDSRHAILSETVRQWVQGVRQREYKAFSRGGTECAEKSKFFGFKNQGLKISFAFFASFARDEFDSFPPREAAFRFHSSANDPVFRAPAPRYTLMMTPVLVMLDEPSAVWKIPAGVGRGSGRLHDAVKR
jgi:hypothetical protein